MILFILITKTDLRDKPIFIPPQNMYMQTKALIYAFIINAYSNLSIYATIRIHTCMHQFSMFASISILYT